MRQIKFRVWSRIYQKLVDVESIDFFKGFVYYMEHDQWERFALKDCDLVQFTGLKDKNGKEIYEGDICKDTNYTKKIPIGVIKWFDEPLPCFSFQIKKNWCVYDEEVDNWEHLEVIGNIYENKELIK